MTKYWIYHYVDRYIGILLCLFLSFFNKIFFFDKENKQNKFNKILIIKLTMMGDTILLTPTVRALKKKFANSFITLICSDVNKNIVKTWKWIDNFIIFDYSEYFKNPVKLIKFIFYIRKQNYDLAVDFEQWFRITPLIVYFSKAKERIGFKTKNQYRHYLFTKSITHIIKKHELECFTDIVKSIGVVVDDKSLELKINQNELKNIEELLKQNNITDKFVVVHPGCGLHGYYRQWNENKFAEVIDYIMDNFNLKVVLTGSKDDIKIVNKIIDFTKNPVSFVNKTNLEQLIALVSKSEFVICGNTGILHIASALDKKTIAIHGPTNSVKWGPWGEHHIIIEPELECVPCSYLGFEYGCKEKKCIEAIISLEVKNAVDKILKK